MAREGEAIGPKGPIRTLSAEEEKKGLARIKLAREHSISFSGPKGMQFAELWVALLDLSLFFFAKKCREFALYPLLQFPRKKTPIGN